MSFTPNGAVASARFSSDGKRIVTGSWDNSAKIWNVETGRAELKLIGHGGYVNSAEFSPDGKWILTASDDRTARIWDAKTGDVLQTFAGHEDRVTAATFSSDGRYVLTASGRQDGPRLGREDGQAVARLQGATNGACCPPPFRKTARESSPAVPTTRPESGTSKPSNRSPRSPVTRPRSRSVAFSPDGLARDHRQSRRHRQDLGCRKREGSANAQRSHAGGHVGLVFRRWRLRAHRQPRRHRHDLAGVARMATNAKAPVAKVARRP